MTRKALIVEDCDSNLAITSFFLKKLGFEVIKVQNSQDFAAIDKNFIPLLIITDWNLDNQMKGDRVVKTFSPLGVPIAVLTSEAHDEIKDDLAGYDYHFFSKPLKFQLLETWLKDLKIL